MTLVGPQAVVIVSFAALLLSAGSAQLLVELGQGNRPQVLEVFMRRPTEVNLRNYEAAMEDGSWLARSARPWMQYLQYLVFSDPGEKALLGCDGWWFYRPGVEYLTRRSPRTMSLVDSVAAIRAFRDDLAGRGIQLVVVPAPNKESVYPSRLVRRAAGWAGGRGRETQALMDGLREAQVEVVDLFELFAVEPSSQAMTVGAWYLAQDSHWSPAGLERAARAVAQRLLERGWIGRGEAVYELRLVSTERVGDVVRMLDVEMIEERVAAEKVVAAQVRRADTGEAYRDDPDSEVLVLGDSFLRVFQEDEPGSAGFLAHLAKELGQPVASIVNEGGASTLVRQELYRRPALIRNKRVVVWEFVERDVRFGTEGWQRVPLPTVGREVETTDLRLN